VRRFGIYDEYSRLGKALGECNGDGRDRSMLALLYFMRASGRRFDVTSTFDGLNKP
jgi:hypothetical protein